MVKKLLAALTALALSVGIVSLTAAPASAHQGDITASAACNPQTHEYDVTYTLTWASVPDGTHAELSTRTGTTTFEDGWNYATWSDWTDRGDSTGAAGSLQWTESLPGTTVGNGPWVYAYTAWSNGYEGSTHHDTRIEGLAGDCATTIVTPGLPTVDADQCTAPGIPATQGTLSIPAADAGSVRYLVVIDGNPAAPADADPAWTVATAGQQVSAPSGQWAHVRAEAIAPAQLEGTQRWDLQIPVLTGAECTVDAPVGPVTDVDQVCVVAPDGSGSYTSGSIVIPSTPGVDYYLVDGNVTTLPSGATPAAAGSIARAPGDYTVFAVAQPGHRLTGYTTPWHPNIAAAEACGDLIVLPLVTPVVSFTQTGCTTAGSYTLDVVEDGLDAGVAWTVSGGLPATLGTHPVNTAGTVTVVATPTDGYGFSGPVPQTWTLTFAGLPDDCLPTLALTGTGSSAGGLGFAAALTAAGALLLLARRRMLAAS